MYIRCYMGVMGKAMDERIMGKKQRSIIFDQLSTANSLLFLWGGRGRVL